MYVIPSTSSSFIEQLTTGTIALPTETRSHQTQADCFIHDLFLQMNSQTTASLLIGMASYYLFLAKSVPRREKELIDLAQNRIELIPVHSSELHIDANALLSAIMATDCANKSIRLLLKAPQ